LIAAAQEFMGTMPGRLFAKPDAGCGHQYADEMIEMFRLQRRHLPAGTSRTASEADRYRHGIHAGAAPGAAGRALRRRQSSLVDQLRGCFSSTRPRAAASWSSSTTWISS
jgi:hypothetical protein